ncbi:hypothetical protein SR1949_03820 [Sphaerospermopsis reniformis]|uniref:PIN domain-containing protein n=1 Tax=Sphaerospermopsis reniformis TaxID=531300 RepID=A0A479ZRF2_9CYAN|nr:type II toxin-antitoxin system VapC family toxin [Sphaerospermopsis reniformis]GCL35290.1 hypothetical protein SR1949_03820 [Sphaerospermopsis reniformis]
MLFVLDCSVAISWCLSDEDNSYANSVYNILVTGNQAIVPTFFWLEISNVLYVAEKRNRNTREQSDTALKLLQKLPIIIDLIPVNETIIATLDLARQYNLAAYDAAYLELAMREKLLLATTDNRLANAAKNLNLLLEDPNV